jgi:hypothetical protein
VGNWAKTVNRLVSKLITRAIGQMVKYANKLMDKLVSGKMVKQVNGQAG